MYGKSCSLTPPGVYIDIDQLTRILQLVGTPDQEYLGKISSDTVSTELVMVIGC